MSTANGSSAASDAVKGAASVVVVQPEEGGTAAKIPAAVFFEDVPAVVEEHGAENLIRQLSELNEKYRFWEAKYVKSRAHLQQKIPDVSRALDAVRALEKQSQRAIEQGGAPLESNFELSDGLYVRASIPPTSTVCLWLGANVMVEYSFDEAVELLTKNLESATNNLKSTEDEISHLRDQINTTDVNLSQVYNRHVQITRKKGARAS